VKTTDRSTSDFDEVVSSQFESYPDDDDVDDNRSLSVMSAVNTPLHRHSSTAHHDNDDDDDDYNDDDNMMIVSQQTSASTSCSNAISSHSRRKRKSPSCRRSYFERSHDTMQSSYNDIDMNKVMCANVGAEYDAVYQIADVSAGPRRQEGTGEQLGCRKPTQNELDYDLRPARHDEQQRRISQHQFEYGVRAGGRDGDQYCRPDDTRSNLLQPRSLESSSFPQYDLDYDIQPNRHGDGFSLTQYYRQDDIRANRYREKVEYSRQNQARPPNHSDNSTALPHYKQNISGPARHRENSKFPQYYMEDERSTGVRLSAEDEGCQYDDRGKSDLLYTSRYGEVTSTASQQTAIIPHSAVPIKSSPEDPDTDQRLDMPALMHSLPLPSSTGHYWPSSYSAKSEDSIKDVQASWPTDDLTATEQSSTYPLYESSNLMTNFIKIEDSSKPDITPASVASSSSSSLSSFCVEGSLRRDSVTLSNVASSKQRRRRRHNPTTAHTLSSSADTNTHLHTSTNSSPADVGYLSSKLPFSLPPVPPGYRLVITHRPTAESADNASQVTQLIIDHPSDSTTLIHSNTAASHASVTPPRTVIIALNYSAPSRSKIPFLIYDIRTLWCSALSTRVSKCQKLRTVG